MEAAKRFVTQKPLQGILCHMPKWTRNIEFLFKGGIGVFLAVGLGILLGVGSYTFEYAEGFSYFSTDPQACANCHIMNDQFDSWRKASHHASANCVDCHMPVGLVEKLIAKADNGYRHSKGFTFQDFHEPIMIKPRNSEILQNNCMRCHQTLTHGITGSIRDSAVLRCVHCHVHVGHGPQR